MQIDRLDHLVLTVRDIKASVAFYTQVLGMRAITFGDNPVFVPSQPIGSDQYRQCSLRTGKRLSSSRRSRQLGMS